MTVTVHAADVVLTMTGEPLPGHAVVVDGGLVAAIGPRSDFTDERIRDWPGVLTPGLVNAHTHLQYGEPFAHLATAGLPFAAWVHELDEISRGLSDTDWQVAARGSKHQLLKSGTTTFADSALPPGRDCTQVLCTRSRAVLGAAALTLEEPPALGTDSLASSPDLDLWAEARATRDVRAGLSDEALVRAVTVGGAEVLGLDAGTLRVGGRADLAVFDVPPQDPYMSLVVHGAGRCVATVAGGRLVHRR